MIYTGQRLHLRLLKSNKSTLVSSNPHLGLVPLGPCPIVHIWAQFSITARPAGPMARRLTTNQEIAGSIPASVISFLLLRSAIYIEEGCCLFAVIGRNFFQSNITR